MHSMLYVFYSTATIVNLWPSLSFEYTQWEVAGALLQKDLETLS